MKRFTIILAVLLIVVAPSTSFAGVIDWMNGTTYIQGHNISGTLTNGIALLCMVAPAILVLAIAIGAYARKVSTKKIRA